MERGRPRPHFSDYLETTLHDLGQHVFHDYRLKKIQHRRKRRTRQTSRESRVEGQESRVKSRESRVEGQESRVKSQGSRVEGRESRVKGRESRVESRGSRDESQESRVKSRGRWALAWYGARASSPAFPQRSMVNVQWSMVKSIQKSSIRDALILLFVGRGLCADLKINCAN